MVNKPALRLTSQITIDSSIHMSVRPSIGLSICLLYYYLVVTGEAAPATASDAVTVAAKVVAAPRAVVEAVAML